MKSKETYLVAFFVVVVVDFENSRFFLGGFAIRAFKRLSLTSQARES
jgi:hypothetical protein